MNNRIVCNPFVFFTPQLMMNIYVLLCYIFEQNIGLYAPTVSSPLLQSPALTELLVSACDEQPILVMNVMWQRVLNKLRMPKDTEIHNLIPSLCSFYHDNKLVRVCL